jgi:hypothetical protein
VARHGRQRTWRGKEVAVFEMGPTAQLAGRAWAAYRAELQRGRPQTDSARLPTEVDVSA